MEYKYFYKGMPLVEYCRKHPEYKYEHATRYISVKSRENPDRPLEEIINEFMTTEHKTYTRYIINGMNLSRYCENENISYTAVSKAISVAKKNKKYSNMSEQEIVQMIIDKYTVGNVEELTFPEPKKLIYKPKNNKND